MSQARGINGSRGLLWRLLSGISLLSGCALSPGQPWGVLDAQLTVGVTPEDGRLDAEARLLTNKSYAYTLDALTLELSSLTVVVGQDEVGTLSFDPAAPPEGYSNCHSGHCHTADGGIATYEEIEAELTGGTPQGTSKTLPVSSTLMFETPTTGAAAENIPLGSCSGMSEDLEAQASCTLESGYVTSVQLTVPRFELRGRLYDTASPSRLPAEGVGFVFSSETALVLSGVPGEADSAAVGKDQALWLNIQAFLPWTAAALDNIDWSSVVAGDEGIVLSDGDPELETVRENLLTHATLQLNITRE